MTQKKLPALRLGHKMGTWFGTPPDPHAKPALYDGVLTRRVFAYLFDVFILVLLWAVGALLASFVTVASLGLLSGLAWAGLAALPLAYHTLLIGFYGQTFGMALMDVQVRTYEGGHPSFLQAFVSTVLFYLGMAATANLVLLVALFTDRNRALHDVLSGTLFVRDSYLDSQKPAP